jgi:ribose-phosphate pyrophosphokinase
MLSVIAGGAHPALAAALSEVLREPLTPASLVHYPDAEVVRVDLSVRDADVFLVQSMPSPPEAHIVELLLMADAAFRAGAARITAVVPYLAYGRQDRRAGGERVAIGARVVADIVNAGHIDRVVTVDLHQPAVEGFFSIPVEHIEAAPLLVDRLRGARQAVVVAPDLGAARLADRVASELGLPFAVIHKTRTSGVEVTATRVTGEVRGLRPIVVDDMITTGRTVQAALEVLAGAGCSGEATVAVTHALFAPGAAAVLAAAPIGRLIVTDTVPVDTSVHPKLEVVPVAPLLAAAISRLHAGRSLSPLRSHR